MFYPIPASDAINPDVLALRIADLRALHPGAVDGRMKLVQTKEDRCDNFGALRLDSKSLASLGSDQT